MLEALTSIDLELGALASERFGRILVAIDDIGGSQPALLHALDLANVAQGSIVCAVFVCSEPLPGENDYASKVRVSASRRKARTFLERVSALAAARGVALEGIVLEGTATDAILEAAVAREVTSIVIGAGERRVLERLLFGGGTDRVLSRRCLPVTVVRT